MNNLQAGIGDVLLRYPELIDDLTDFERLQLETMKQPYVAVHLSTNLVVKVPPQPRILLDKLLAAGVQYVLVGHDGEGPKPKLRKHIEVVKRASKFIGTLSCFNVVAQLSRVPSLVLANSAVKEPFIFALMTERGARVEFWNGRKPEELYDSVIDWVVK